MGSPRRIKVINLGEWLIPIERQNWCIFFIADNSNTLVYPPKMFSDGSEKSFIPKCKQSYPWITHNFRKDVVLCSCANVENRNYFDLSTKQEPASISMGFSNGKKATKIFKYMKKVIVTSKLYKWKLWLLPFNQFMSNLTRILENSCFLSQQGYTMLGGNDNGNFIQLLTTVARYNSRIYKWLEKRR